MVTIRQRSDGRYEARVRFPERRYSVYGKTEAEVRAKLAELERRLALDQPPPAHLTVRQLAERWLETERRRWKPRTYADYQRLLERHVYPAIGRVRLRQLTADRLQRLCDAVPGRAASQVYRALHRCFALAVRWGYLGSNPLDRVTPPVYRPPRPDVPDVEGLQRLFQHCLDSSDDYAPLVGLTLLVGWRLGEALALRWDDVDLAEGLVHIRRSGQWLDGQWVETPPKTRAGHRTVAIGALGVRLFKRQKAVVARRKLAAGSAWKEHDLVFPSTTGRPLSSDRVSAAVRRLCRASGLAAMHFHGLRHAAACLGLAAGVPLADVSKRLGHASPAITMSVYAHAIGDGRAVAERLEAALVR